MPAIESSLPDPRLMLGWYETPVETRVGSQELSLGIQQTIPFPTKLTTRSRLGRTLARRARVAYERAARDVLVEVIETGHELAYLDEAARIADRVGALLERYVAAATAEETGSPLPELFRAETQRAQLDNDRVLLAELRAAEEERLRALLDLPPTLPLGAPRIGAIPAVRATLDELLATAEAHNQELAEAGLEVEAAALRTSLARKQRLPDLTLGYTHIFTDTLPPFVGANPPDNGQDPQIVQLGLTVPLWAGRNRAQVRRAEALARAAEMDRQATRLGLRHRVARAWLQVGNAERLERLYGEVLLPRARAAARTAEDLQKSGKGTLAGTIETAAVIYNFALAAARARADHGQAVAQLEAILGRPLVATQGEEQ